MVVKSNVLIVRERLPYERINKSIDLFFSSLAEDVRRHTIGVILSGGGDDALKEGKPSNSTEEQFLFSNPRQQNLNLCHNLRLKIITLTTFLTLHKLLKSL